MKLRRARRCTLAISVAAIVLIYCIGGLARTGKNQGSGVQPKPSTESPEKLKQEFVALLRAGDADKFLTFVPKGGLNAGANAEHMSRDEVEQQIRHRRGIYCKLFDSSCIQGPINLGASARACSYREALNHSPDARTAATETVRNGVRQAIVVAQVNDKKCPDIKLIDLIFNLQSDGWKLFSVP